MLTQEKIKVLIIDDDEDDYFIISDYLNDIDGTQLVPNWCNNYNEAVSKINDGDYDIYLIDYRLGAGTGLDLLKEVSGVEDRKPLILLTGKGNRQIDVEAMRFGATDYLIKSDLDAEKLERSIRYSLDRYASLKALKESENKYRNLFESSRDVLFIANNDLLLIEVNETAVSFFGYNKDQLRMHVLYDFIPDLLIREKISCCVKDKKNIDGLELEIENAKRETRNCILSLLIETKTSNSNLCRGVIHDITNIKKAEQMNLQSAKLAANERLVRILAHEIRNPLNNIQLSAENLEILLGETSTHQPLLNIIRRNTGRINQMITELLRSTKTMELEFEKHALQDVVEESLSFAKDRIELQKIKLNRLFFPNPLYVWVDKAKLQLAFSNILINAIEAMEADKGELSVSITDGLEHYRVAIKDNGKGIPPEYLSNIFEPFFTMKKNGMGLGLSAAYGIFQSHKATLQVESVPDSGTTFIMDFNKTSE
jgi:two-component system, sporulation sensor kinase E